MVNIIADREMDSRDHLCVSVRQGGKQWHHFISVSHAEIAKRFTRRGAINALSARLCGGGLLMLHMQEPREKDISVIIAGSKHCIQEERLAMFLCGGVRLVELHC